MEDQGQQTSFPMTVTIMEDQGQKTHQSQYGEIMTCNLELLHHNTGKS